MEEKQPMGQAKYKGSFSFYADKAMMAIVKEKLEAEKKPISFLIERLLEEWLDWKNRQDSNRNDDSPAA
jgi:hypothetical protein